MTDSTPTTPTFALNCIGCSQPYGVRLDPERLLELRDAGVPPGVIATSFNEAITRRELLCPACSTARDN